jgi:hypothetical protein
MAKTYRDIRQILVKKVPHRVSQHLALLCRRGIVHAGRVGNVEYYSLADARILDACHITREILLQQLTRQGMPAAALSGTSES